MHKGVISGTEEMSPYGTQEAFVMLKIMVLESLRARGGDEMPEHKLENGSVITNADIERICREFETESWSGRPSASTTGQ